MEKSKLNLTILPLKPSSPFEIFKTEASFKPFLFIIRQKIKKNSFR